MQLEKTLLFLTRFVCCLRSLSQTTEANEKPLCNDLRPGGKRRIFEKKRFSNYLKIAPGNVAARQSKVHPLTRRRRRRKYTD
jgi:hypothetical protein